MKKILKDVYKSLLGSAERILSGGSDAPDELMVLCMHSTPVDRLRDFEKICDRLLDDYRPLNADKLGVWFSGELREGPYLLFTFDDGLKNNLGAASALGRRGIGAYFFPVPAFVEAANGEQYYRNHIRRIINPNFDHEPEDFQPMTLDDLRDLIRSGHKIGSHSMSHALHTGMDQMELQREIAGSRRWLEEKLGVQVDAFCSPFNTSLSINASAKKLIAENYSYHFTTYPGLNGRYRDAQMICRRNIETDWSQGKISFATGHWDLKRWQGGIELFRSL